MTDYTASHWGIYEVHRAPGTTPRLSALTGDPDPSEIGLHQLDPAILESRVERPAIRKSWLEQGSGAAPELRGKEPFIEVSWEPECPDTGHRDVIVVAGLFCAILPCRVSRPCQSGAKGNGPQAPGIRVRAAARNRYQ